MSDSWLDGLLRQQGASRIILWSTMLLAAILLIYFFGIYGLESAGSNSSQRNHVADAGVENVSAENGSAADNESFVLANDTASDNNEAAIDLERRVLGTRNESAKKVLAQAEAAQRGLESAHREWRELIDNLQSNRTGRILASDADELPVLMESVRLAERWEDEVSGYQGQVERIRADFDQFLAGGASGDITGATLTAIESLRDEIQTKREQVTKSLARVRQQIEETEGMPPGEKTLAEAIRDFEQDEIKRQREELMAAREAARKEARERVAAAEKAKLEAETKLQETELAAETEKLKAMEEAKRIAAAEAKIIKEAENVEAELRAEFQRDMREIKSLLSPFVTPANWTLHSFANNGHPYYLQSNQKTGVSFSVIGQLGALEPTDEGLDIMAKLGESKYRPLGTFPKYNPSDWRRNANVKKRLERAQELLLKYGDLMVETGMLEK